MWDYNKLFAENNVVGLTVEDGEKVYNQVVSNPDYWNDGQNVNWDLYKNNQLSSYEETGFKFEIKYIIRLDEHGNVVEKLFDRDRDMKPEPNPMPELEDGMFIRVLFGGNPYDQPLGFINLNRGQIVYQEGSYDLISNMNQLTKTKIVEVYSPEVMSFTSCKYNKPIWRDLEYQAYLDSKSN